MVAPLNLSRTYLLTAFAGLTLGTDLVLQMFGRVSVNTQLVVVLRDAFWCKLNKYNLRYGRSGNINGGRKTRPPLIFNDCSIILKQLTGPEFRVLLSKSKILTCLWEASDK